MRRDSWTLLAILGLALAIRLILWAMPTHQPANDEVEYLTVARDLLAGHGWRFYEHYAWLRAPLYPLFLAGSLALANGDAHWASLPAIAISVATVYLFFLLGQASISVRLHASGAESPRAQPGIAEPDLEAQAIRAGLFAALLGAVLLTLATFANLWMSETLWSFLFSLVLLLLLLWCIRPRLMLAGCAGFALGLATLTRSLPLVFVPVIVAWMVGPRLPCRLSRARFQNSESRTRNTRIWLHALFFVLLFLLTLSPWSVRNWRAYGGFIPVETGLAYNLWAFNEPGLKLETIIKTLSAIRNPVERAAYAQQRGLERLSEDPMILARKLWPNTLAILRVKVIEDRFIRQNYYSDVGLPYLVASLLFDDLLSLLILLTATWGLGRVRPSRGFLLAVLWIVYVYVTTALTHGEARYRHFLYPVLIPYSGAVLAGALSGARRRQRLASALLGATLALLVLGSYPWGWARANLVRASWQAVADWRHWRGNLQGALEAEKRALVDGQVTSDSWIRIALAHQRLDQTKQAIQSYRAALSVHRDYYPASVRLGSLLRSLGHTEEARKAFKGEWVAPETVTEWGWDNLVGPAPERIDVGDMLDVGYVDGVHAPEQYNGTLVRWTNGQAKLRLAGGPERLLLLRIAAPRPADAPPAKLTLCYDDRCVLLPSSSAWQNYRVLLPAHEGDRLVTLHSTTFIPTHFDDHSSDTRRLGVILDTAATTVARRQASPSHPTSPPNK